MTTSRFARLATVAAVAVLLLAVSGCSSHSDPWFKTPIAWGQGQREPAKTGLAGAKSVSTTIELLDGTHARLKDFPKGTSKTLEGSNFCLSVAGTSRYSGNATWSNVNGGTI
jgi:hypothetical protein